MRRAVVPVLFASLFACNDVNPPNVNKRAQVDARPAAPAAPTPEPAPEPAPDPFAERLGRYAVAELTADVSGLSASERAVLDKLIAAARQMDPIFDRQAWAGNPALREQLTRDTSVSGLNKREYFTMMRGPWDRQDHWAPFATDKPHPPGAGFYPEDLTAEQFKKWVADHPADRAAFESLTTVIVKDGPDLAARPYSEVYKEWLTPAAAALQEAAALTDNKSLKTFLELRAAAFASDDYYASDKAWMDVDSPVEITIGPYETYEDELLNLKASFEAFVTVADPKASADLAKFKKYLPAMEQHLPIPDAIKTKRGSASPIRVVDLVFTAGDARKSVQTIAFNLPNDEKVRAEKGAKKVLLRNLIATKFNSILRPIGERVLDPTQVPLLDDQAFFQQVLFHELSHSLGPAFTKNDKKLDVRVALGTAYSPLEEAKADVMGVYNLLFMIEKGEVPPDLRDKMLVSYFAGLFRSVRFGVAEAHGKGAALQINRLVEAGAATVKDGRYSLDLGKVEQAVADLVRDICVLQSDGDAAAAEAFLARYGVVAPDTRKALDGLTNIPVDILPRYPLAGEIVPK
jgi:hypothetical protein